MSPGEKSADRKEVFCKEKPFGKNNRTKRTTLCENPDLVALLCWDLSSMRIQSIFREGTMDQDLSYGQRARPNQLLRFQTRAPVLSVTIGICVSPAVAKIIATITLECIK